MADLTVAEGLRVQVIACAREYKGLGRKDSLQFWSETCPTYSAAQADAFLKKQWCGAFALSVLRKCGLTSWHWIMSKGFLYCDDSGKSCAARLPIVRIPAPGDIAYFNKPSQHYALVVSVSTDQRRVKLIAGNTPIVAESECLRTAAVYYSIQPLIDARVLLGDSFVDGDVIAANALRQDPNGTV